ncbi:MAG: hypothetical protein ACFCVD_10720 [Nodosilinea sp.]
MTALTRIQSTLVVLGSTLVSTGMGILTVSAPAQAASFSEVRSEFAFSNFSHSAVSTNTQTFTDTLTIGTQGSVTALSSALANFTDGSAAEIQASNSIASLTAGSGRNYVGLAESQAALVGDFVLVAHETFSFDFDGFLELSTGIDDDSLESAFALGGLGFSVSGVPLSSTGTPWVDQLNLVASLDTPGVDDVLDTNLFQLLLAGNQSNIIIKSLGFDRQVGGRNESLLIGFTGTYQRTFTETTLVSLAESKTGVAAVQAVPAPSLIWGLLSYGGLGLMGKLRQRPGRS